MADVVVKIITPAESFALLTRDELKIGLGIAPGDTTQDSLLDQLIDRYSDTVAEICNRVFAKETVQETWRWLDGRRLFLSHWPVKQADLVSVESPRGSILPASDYELEERSGKISLYGSRAEPIVVTYTGGFILPAEAPPALKQAAELLIRADRAEKQRQDTAGMRQLSHKGARIMFFDPNQQSRTTATAQVGVASQAVHALLMNYVRLEV